jgi:hypothetical protein
MCSTASKEAVIGSSVAIAGGIKIAIYSLFGLSAAKRRGVAVGFIRDRLCSRGLTGSRVSKLFAKSSVSSIKTSEDAMESDNVHCEVQRSCCLRCLRECLCNPQQSFRTEFHRGCRYYRILSLYLGLWHYRARCCGQRRTGLVLQRSGRCYGWCQSIRLPLWFDQFVRYKQLLHYGCHHDRWDE